MCWPTKYAVVSSTRRSVICVHLIHTLSFMYLSRYLIQNMLYCYNAKKSRRTNNMRINY